MFVADQTYFAGGFIRGIMLTGILTVKPNNEYKKWKLSGPRVHVNLLLKPYPMRFSP